jgi:GNAT superfamily N-acetyltransferase
LVRRITAADRAQVLGAISDGLYGGNDYLPAVFDAWLQRPHQRLMFGTFRRGGADELLADELLAFEVLSLFDGGTSVMFQALRVLPSQQGRGLARQLGVFLKRHAREALPRANRMRVCCHLWNDDGRRSARMQRRNGCTDWFRMGVLSLKREPQPLSASPPPPPPPWMAPRPLGAHELWSALQRAGSDVAAVAELLHGGGLMHDWEVHDFNGATLEYLQRERGCSFFGSFAAPAPVGSQEGAGAAGATVLTSFSLGGPSPRANGLQTYVTVQLLPCGSGGGASDGGDSARAGGAAQEQAVLAVARHLCRWVAWAASHGSNRLVSFHNASEDGMAEQPCTVVGAAAAGAAGAQLEAGGWRHTSDLNGPMVVLSQALALAVPDH